MCRLSQILLKLLGDADGEVVGMTLSVFTNMLWSQDILVSSSTAPKLAEALLELFDHVSFFVPNNRYWVRSINFVPTAFSGVCLGGL